jgi:hypothetical protein
MRILLPLFTLSLSFKKYSLPQLEVSRKRWGSLVYWMQEN